MRYRARLSIAILTTGFIGMIILAAAPVFAQTQQQQRQQLQKQQKAAAADAKRAGDAALAAEAKAPRREKAWRN